MISHKLVLAEVKMNLVILDSKYTCEYKNRVRKRPRLNLTLLYVSCGCMGWSFLVFFFSFIFFIFYMPLTYHNTSMMIPFSLGPRHITISTYA